MKFSISLLLAFIAFVVVIWWLFSALYKTFKLKDDGSVDVNRLSRTIGFGITIVFFYATFGGIFSLIIKLVTTASDLLVGGLTGNEFDSKADNFLERIVNFPYGTMILFMIVWIITSMCIQQVMQNTANEKIKLFEDNRIAKNVFVSLILAFSLYLCIASIIAIPEFQELENITVDKQEITTFSKSLEDSALTRNLGTLGDFAKEPNLDTLKSPEAKHRQNQIILVYDRFKDNVDLVKNDIDLKRRQIIINYQTALEEKTLSKQKSVYKSKLTNWYLEQQKMLSVLSAEKGEIESHIHERITSINNLDKAILKAGADKKKVMQDYYDSDLDFKTMGSRINVYNDTLNRAINKGAPMPQRPNIGEEFGIFESMSGWLLRTESMSLALIVGLFAFGLLGAIGSSFIRQKINTTEREIVPDYVPNMPVVLISGLSSAIVVFLAAKGAIVVFSTKDAALNPYVLFFTCLVAAVYSEDIWAWARKRLQSSFNTSDNKNTRPDTPAGKNQKDNETIVKANNGKIDPPPAQDEANGNADKENTATDADGEVVNNASSEQKEHKEEKPERKKQ
ncbi:MAG TPA: hypothetical protein VIM55_15410 [Mucilaginibacter sp.]